MREDFPSGPVLVRDEGACMWDTLVTADFKDAPGLDDGEWESDLETGF